MPTSPADAYIALTTALRERLAVIGDREAYARDPEAHLERLKIASEEITRCTRLLPQPIAPELAHYLQRASYDKALVWLESQQS
jgi:hypothetical protein